MFQLSEYKPEMKFYSAVKNPVLITFHRRRKKKCFVGGRSETACQKM